MSDIRRNADRNRAIQAMMTDGEQLKTFYRFVANNPHIALHDACQIVIERPNASVCFSFEEWNAQGRRVTKGRKGIPYYDSDGNKYFVFDVADTHGENRYRRITQPVKKILDGLDLLNGTEIAESNRGDYRIMLSGVVTYLGQNDFLTENDEIRNRLIAEGVAYSLYSTTGFPKERGITLKGYHYGLQDNADLFREVQKAVEVLQQDINDAIYNKQNEVPVIDDIDEEYVSDEPVIPKADEKPAIEEEKASVSPFYAKYSELQKANPDSIVVYRLGDFYEVMGEKAEQAATILDLTLTGRNVGLDERIPMCGFPYHVADRYFGKLTESVSVVVVEPDAEPFKILSRDEARKTSELEELSPEESAELDSIFSEQDEAEEQPDYVGEIDTRFPIDDDYGDEDEPTDEEIEEAFEVAEAEESDEETEDYDYEEDKKLTKETKPENRGKPIWERRNRPSMQRSLFDAFEEQTPEEKLKEWGLKRGSGFEYGKYRIYEKYQENPTDKEFADFLRREYGTGGGGYDDEIWTDGKGMKLRHRDRENPENEVGMILKWEQVAYGIADLIDEDKYFDDKESEEYITFLSERRGTDENRVKAIARHIAEDGVKRNENGERTTFLSWRYADYKFCKDHAAEIEKALNACPEVDTAKIDGDKVEITVKEAYRRYSEQPSEKTVRDLDAEEDEEWENRIESGEITPIEPVGESTKESNTDLTKIGFEQNELGGAKQRFKNNIEAIKLVNRLINSQKEATDDERKVLAKYVGWGGLAQAFDEHNVAWKSEYEELKDVLSVEEYAAAKGSVLNAHYTSKTVIDGIYKALTRFGVKGNNRILEPAMGTGNFFGFMPQEIANGAKLYGVELDRVTGKIATKLYPQAKIQIKGFEETAFHDNFFDLMVTNVPFGGYTVFDPDYNKYNFYIHDYFIAKGIDKIKPNGLMAVITSKGTMDKQNPSIRKYIADRAELVGAVRLPNTAFKQTANTEVVTDILFFRKREERINAGVENTEWLSTGKTEEGYEINNYYIAHPEMVLGILAKEHGLYGAEDITVKPDGRDLSEAINTAISRLPQDFYVNPEYTEEAESKEEVEVDYDVKPMNLKAVNGKLYMRVGDSMVEQPVPSFPKDAYQRIVEMIAIRKQLRKVLDLQVEGCSDDVLTREQWQLGARYDMFVKRFGYINSKNNLRLFKPDGDSALLFACENVSDDEETVTKADVFTKRTIRPYTAVTSTDDCFEALQISKNERGSVDISYIEELTKKDYDTVLAELGNAVFRNPVAVNPEDKYSGFETAEEYLSGRVVDKLQAAERMKQSNPDLIDYDKNISALREVQPSPVRASDIAVRVGTSWIDKELYKEFFCELIGKLIERGIPENEIAFIHDANTDKAKQDLFNAINAGTVRVLIGSTEKCGAGTNVQERLVAIHHLDAPYRPRDLIQRDGRGIRQGNRNKIIRIYTYAEERTFDSYSYQILETKQRFISQVEKGDMTVREADDIDEATLSYAEIKAITSANPKIKRKMELDMEMARLRDLESRYKKELFALQDKVRKEFPEQIQRQELYLERVRKDVELVKEKYNPEHFEINVGGTVYSDNLEDGKKNGGLALMDALFHNKTGTVVAEYCGFKISLNPIELLSNERSITLSGAGQYKMDIGESASGNLTRLENFVKEFATREERAVKRLESTKADFEVAKEQVKVPFEHKDKIMELNTELSELNAELDLNKREEVVIDDGEEDGETNETEEVYAALPKKQTKTRKQKKTMLTKKLYRTYKQTEEKNPGAMVFAVKNGDYTCFDDTTEELMALSSLSPSYFKVGEKDVKTLTIDETLFKEFADAFVSAGLKIALFDEPEEEKTFIDESDKVAAMQVDILPDYTVSQEQMHEYGYAWDGMLPVRVRTARVLYGTGVELYRLGKDDTEGKVENGDFEDTESLYGVEKPAWEAFITSEKGKAYLTAWHNVVESASKVVNDEMSYLDGAYADALSNVFFEEREAIEKVLHGEYASSEEAKPYLKPLLERYHKRFPLDILLEYYGWDNDDVYKALAENIPDAELREYATKVENEPVSVEAPSYKELVRNSVEKEFEEFKANLMGKSAEEIFQNNYEIHVKTELFDTLCGEYVDVGEEYYKALYEEVDHGGILQQLYDDFLGSEYASVSTGEDTLSFIKDYCEHYHDDILREERIKQDEKQAIFLGKDENGVACYHFKDSLSSTNLHAIKEKAERYVIVSPACYIARDTLKKHHIDFLKVGRDIGEDETQEFTVTDVQEAVERKQRERETAKDNIYLHSGSYAQEHGELDKYLLSHSLDEECVQAIGQAISDNYADNRLGKGFEQDLISEYGLERVKHIVTTLIRRSEWDRRYSTENREWANSTAGYEDKSDEKRIYSSAHPGLIDLFADRVRKIEKQKKEEHEEQMSENTRDYTKITARGDKVVNIEKDNGGRDIAIIDRTATSNKDYVVAIGYHTETGDWEQGRYGFESQKKAENWRKNEYGSEKSKIEYTKINVANDAFIKKSGVGSVFKMPTNGEYAGFTYYMFNDKIRPSRQLVDLQSDSRELCYELSVRDDREIELRKGYGDNEQIVVLTAEEFKKAVGGTTNKDYETQENTDTKWLNTSVPQEAFRKEYPKSMLFVLPNKQDFGGMSFFIPTAFVGEDKNSDDGRILIRLPEDFVIKAQSRDETREATLTAYDFNQLCNNTTAEDYKQAQAESAPGSETPSDWNYVSVPEKARIASFDESTLFRMPDGKYQDYTYYIPNKCIKDNAEKGTIRLSLHNDYTVRLSDNSGEEKKTAELSAKDFCEEVRGKDAVAYGTEYKRPSVEANTSFDEKEKALRIAVPDEMKARPNWVVVKTWWNADKGKYNKRPVNCNSDKGEYAESDNPETWTTFDNALKYLKEKGGTTVAYALDGKDNVSCIDLDRCYDENGQPSALAKDVLSKCGKTYVEKSVSGNGLHIFGKTSGMDIRTFSKDGDLEFYQKEHFIAMTGDGAGYSRLESFDTSEMKELLSRKCEKREEWKGVCKGVNGLSTMTDRDVVEKASNAKNGDKFKRLYAGEDLQNNHSNSDMSLMNLLAYWCNGDKEQMLRIFATSGLFRPNKSPDYYEGTAIKALRSMPVKSTYTPTVPKNTGGNGKR